jgi:tRNA (guanine-N7-)-methyltransferase
MPVKLPGTQHQASYQQALEDKAQRLLAIRSYLDNWQKNDHPSPTEAPKEIILEIGCGHGHFLTAYAHQYPNNWFLGIDLMQGRLLKAQKKKERLQLHHLHFLKAEISELLSVWPQNRLLDKAYLLFSDPWPKRKHHKNRIVQTDFLNQLALCMKPNGLFYFRTDDLNYFEWTLNLIKKNPYWKLVSEASWGFECPTIFEQKSQKHFSCIGALQAQTCD